jgi:hypothetical protein
VRIAGLCNPLRNTAGGRKDEQAGNFFDRNRLSPLRAYRTKDGPGGYLCGSFGVDAGCTREPIGEMFHGFWRLEGR